MMTVTTIRGGGADGRIHGPGYTADGDGGSGGHGRAGDIFPESNRCGL